MIWACGVIALIGNRVRGFVNRGGRTGPQPRNGTYLQSDSDLPEEVCFVCVGPHAGANAEKSTMDEEIPSACPPARLRSMRPTLWVLSPWALPWAMGPWLGYEGSLTHDPRVMSQWTLGLGTRGPQAGPGSMSPQVGCEGPKAHGPRGMGPWLGCSEPMSPAP